MLGGEHKGKGANHPYAEWVQHSAKVPAEEYREIAQSFNPSSFDASEWAKTLKDCGLKYVVITAKHHDGFALFHSSVSDYNIVQHTPFKRDLIAELCKACQAEGLKFGVYYSHAIDWDEPNAPHMHAHNKVTRLHPKLPADFIPDFDTYLRQKSLPQVEELVKNYPLDLIWFDTPINMTYERAKPFHDVVRKYRPECLINSRIIHRGKGVITQESTTLYDYASIDDKEIPTKRLPLYVETPDSVGSSFAYKTTGKFYYHTLQEMIHRLVNTVCTGGNALVNNGPMGNGLLDPQAIKLYKQVSAWLDINGEAIYNTRRNPLAHTPSWGNISISKDRRSLYLHVMQWPVGELKLQKASFATQKAELLGSSAKVQYAHKGDTLTIKTGVRPIDDNCTVIKLHLKAPLLEQK